MAYAISKKSIFRRCLALILCICLFVCAAIPAFAAPVVIPGADPVSVGFGLAASALLSAFGFGATGDDEELLSLPGEVMQDGIDSGFINADGTVNVYPSDAAGVYFVSEDFCNWYNEALAQRGFFLNASFYSQPGLIYDGQIITAQPYDIINFINSVPVGLDSSFASWWGSNSSSYFSQLVNSPFCCIDVDAYGVNSVIAVLPQTDMVEQYGGEFRVYVEFKGTLHSVRSMIANSSQGDILLGNSIFYANRASDGSWSGGIGPNSYLDITSLISTDSYLVPFDGFRTLRFGSLGTWSIDPYSFIPPADPPGQGVSVSVAYPAWGGNASDNGDLPLSIPASPSDAVTQPSDVAQGTVDSTKPINYNSPLNKIIHLLSIFKDSVIGQFSSVLATIVSAADALGLDIAEWGQAIVNAVNDFKTVFVNGFNQWMQRIQQAITNVRISVESIYNWTATFFDSLEVSLRNAFSESLDFISDCLEALVYEVDDFWTSVDSGFADVISRLKDWYDAFIEFQQKIRDFLERFWAEWMANVGEAVDAVVSPIVAAIEAVIESIEQLPEGFRDWKEDFKKYLADGFGFTNIWHYVTSWIGCISGFVGQILAIWSKLPYCMVVPVYACVTLTIVFGVYRRFIR